MAIILACIIDAPIDAVIQRFGSLGGILNHVTQAEKQLAKFGYSGAEIYVECLNVSAADMIRFANGARMPKCPEMVRLLR